MRCNRAPWTQPIHCPRFAAKHNAVSLEQSSGRRVLLRGKGAGRWPTALSVVGDLLEIARDDATLRGTELDEPEVQHVAG